MEWNVKTACLFLIKTVFLAIIQPYVTNVKKDQWLMKQQDSVNHAIRLWNDVKSVCQLLSAPVALIIILLKMELAQIVMHIKIVMNAIQRAVLSAKKVFFYRKLVVLLHSVHYAVM